MLLTGTFHRTLDEKYRLALPKRLRDALGTDVRDLYLAPGTDGSLSFYTPEAFSQVAQQLSGYSPTAEDVRAFSRMFYAHAERVDVDRQGRVRIPGELVQLATLGREIVLLGVGDHLELWDKSRWDDYLGEKQPQYDQIAENAFSGKTAAREPAREPTTEAEHPAIARPR